MAVYLSRNTVFAATAAPLTVLKIITPTSFNIKVHSLGISTDGVTSSAVPLTLDWGTSDETTAGTSVGSPVTTQISGAAIAHGITLGQNFSAEGTTYTIHETVFVPQYMGIFVIQFPLGLEPESPAGLADSFFLRVTATAAVNVRAFIKWSRA